MTKGAGHDGDMSDRLIIAIVLLALIGGLLIGFCLAAFNFFYDP